MGVFVCSVWLQFTCVSWTETNLLKQVLNVSLVRQEMLLHHWGLCGPLSVNHQSWFPIFTKCV